MLLGSQALVNDPYRDNVVLHLRGYDAQSGQSFKDYSKYNRTITANGNVAHSTAQNKYGNSSIYFDGNGDYLIDPASSDFNFGTGDFTIEAWVKINQFTLLTICSLWHPTYGYSFNVIYNNSNSKFGFGVNGIFYYLSNTMTDSN